MHRRPKDHYKRIEPNKTENNITPDFDLGEIERVPEVKSQVMKHLQEMELLPEDLKLQINTCEGDKDFFISLITMRRDKRERLSKISYQLKVEGAKIEQAKSKIEFSLMGQKMKVYEKQIQTKYSVLSNHNVNIMMEKQRLLYSWKENLEAQIEYINGILEINRIITNG